VDSGDGRGKETHLDSRDILERGSSLSDLLLPGSIPLTTSPVLRSDASSFVRASTESCPPAGPAEFPRKGANCERRTGSDGTYDHAGPIDFAEYICARCRTRDPPIIGGGDPCRPGPGPRHSPVPSSSGAEEAGLETRLRLRLPVLSSISKPTTSSSVGRLWGIMARRLADCLLREPPAAPAATSRDPSLELRTMTVASDRWWARGATGRPSREPRGPGVWLARAVVEGAERAPTGDIACILPRNY